MGTDGVPIQIATGGSVSEPPANAITHVPGGHLPARPVATGLWVLRGGQEGRPQLVAAVLSALCRRRGQGTAGRDDQFADGGRAWPRPTSNRRDEGAVQ
jgi:hypothetical protein